MQQRQPSSSDLAWWQQDQETWESAIDSSVQEVHHIERDRDGGESLQHEQNIILDPEPDLFHRSYTCGGDRAGTTTISSMADDEEQPDTAQEETVDAVLGEWLRQLCEISRAWPAVPSASDTERLGTLLVAVGRVPGQITRTIADQRVRLECAKRLRTTVDEVEALSPPPQHHCRQAMTRTERREFVDMVKKHAPDALEAPASSTSTFTCPICCEEHAREAGIALYCSHEFCPPCLRRWIPDSPNGDCPVCRRSLLYGCGHDIPEQRLRSGAEFTREQLGFGCGSATHEAIQDRRALFTRALLLERRPDWTLLLPGDVTPSIADAVSMHHGSWNLGAALIKIGMEHGSQSTLGLGLRELERYVCSTESTIEVVTDELKGIERKLSKCQTLGMMEKTALYHIRQELYKVLKKLISSMHRTKPRLESVRDSISSAGPGRVDMSDSCSHGPQFDSWVSVEFPGQYHHRLTENYHRDLRDTYDQILKKAEGDFCEGKCNGFIRALIFDRLMRRADLYWRPVLNRACECYAV
ncbi:hypothetical protein F5X99DRAFT_255221 [Biscogniauxia marginata]|nr:hypothetical protein F5X99DRAFT_255221 [Biscogniauxia marginata]